MTASLSPAFPLVWRSELLGGSRTALVVVTGELDRVTSPALRDHLEWWLSQGCAHLIVDTADVTFADSAALDALRAIGRRATALGCRVELLSTGAALGRLIALAGRPPGVHVDAR
jgi:anti-sigma B factor antagonist